VISSELLDPDPVKNGPDSQRCSSYKTTIRVPPTVRRNTLLLTQSHGGKDLVGALGQPLHQPVGGGTRLLVVRHLPDAFLQSINQPMHDFIIIINFPVDLAHFFSAPAINQPTHE